MLRKLILFFASIIICLPLYANRQVQIDTSVDAQLYMQKYYSTISDSTNITDGLYYIDQNGINSDLENVTNPFNIRAGFTTDLFIITFVGSVAVDQTVIIDVTCSDNFYYINGSTNIPINHNASIINETPSSGQLLIEEGSFYTPGTPTSNQYSFQIKSDPNTTIPAGRYFTDITISLVEN